MARWTPFTTKPNGEAGGFRGDQKNQGPCISHITASHDSNLLSRHLVAKYAPQSWQNTVSLVRYRAWSCFEMAFPGLRLHPNPPPPPPTKRQLPRLLFDRNVIHDNNNYTVYTPMTHSTSNIDLQICTCYKSARSSCRRPYVTDRNPKIARKWYTMFEFIFNQRQ